MRLGPRCLALCFALAMQGVLPAAADAADDVIDLCVSAETRVAVRSEMRQLLDAVHGIHVALGERDFELLTERAAAVGGAMKDQVEHQRHGHPPGLPHEFVKLGRATHAAFDDLANLSREGGRPRELLPALAAVTAHCVSCHARYRLAEDGDCIVEE